MELRLPTAEQLRTVYDADLKQAFPPEELRGLESMEELWRSGRYRPYCLFDGDNIVGECLLWLGRPGWGLLEFLCVSPRCRNAGLGAVILRELRKAEAESVIFGEAEAPEDAPDPVMAERRLGFYARNGLRTAGYDTELFGVHFKTLYLAENAVDDKTLLREHQFVYESCFKPQTYKQYIRIPYDPKTEKPGPKVPWQS